jgi:Domain of unknown function (DUF4112)
VRSERSNNDARLDRYLLVANALDELFRVPGTKWRVGLDPILGLLPGAGDLITALIGAYGMVVAQQLGVPGSIQLRMLMNLLIDTAIGAIPLLGDLFDFAFKAHARNARLLQDWMSRPRATRRSSVVMLLGMLTVLVVSVGGAVWLVFAGLRALFRMISAAG